MKKIKMQSVASSNILAIGYDEPSETLQVQFIHSGNYLYSGVPKYLYVALMADKSVGGFLRKNISGGQFKCEKVVPTKVVKGE